MREVLQIRAIAHPWCRSIVIEASRLNLGALLQFFLQKCSSVQRRYHFFYLGQPRPLICLFSFSSPSGIKLGSQGPESAALSTRPPPRPQRRYHCLMLLNLVAPQRAKHLFFSMPLSLVQFLELANTS